MSSAIVLEGVTKTFGRKVAVNDLDLDVPAGAIYGFIGPNGAGKTTAIRMIMSIIFADSGDISVLGNASALEAKDRIGYLPEERGIYKKMRVGSYLQYIGALKGLPSSGLREKVRHWLSRVGLAEVERKKCEELSKGMQQKVQLLASILHEPDLLILDEPFSGLDPVNMRMLRELIVEQNRRGATIIFSTHVMPQAEQLCDHIVMINEGQKVLDDTLASIRAQYDPRSLLFEPLDPEADITRLRSLSGICDVTRANGVYEISLEEGTEPSRAMALLAAAMPAARIELHRPSLEDIFIQIVMSSSESGQTRAADLRAALRGHESMPEESR